MANKQLANEYFQDYCKSIWVCLILRCIYSPENTVSCLANFSLRWIKYLSISLSIYLSVVMMPRMMSSVSKLPPVGAQDSTQLVGSNEKKELSAPASNTKWRSSEELDFSCIYCVQHRLSMHLLTSGWELEKWDHGCWTSEQDVALRRGRAKPREALKCGWGSSSRVVQAGNVEAALAEGVLLPLCSKCEALSDEGERKSGDGCLGTHRRNLHRQRRMTINISSLLEKVAFHSIIVAFFSWRLNLNHTARANSSLCPQSLGEEHRLPPSNSGMLVWQDGWDFFFSFI